MTLPNKLTMLRILIIPVMVIVWYIPWVHENYVFGGFEKGYDGLSWCFLIEFILFAIASITDFLDGSIARKYNLITTFGKFADPLADKMLVFTAMVLLMIDNQNNMPAWVFVIMIIREFMVSGIRMLVASKGVVIPAGKLGKWKTAVTMVAIIVLFFSHLCFPIQLVGQILMYAAGLLTVVSGVEYLYHSREVIFESI